MAGIRSDQVLGEAGSGVGPPVSYFIYLCIGVVPQKRLKTPALEQEPRVT